MIRRFLMIAVITLTAGSVGTASAVMLQPDASAQLRASGQVGEQSDGYLGIVGSAPAELRARVDAVNIKRRAYYTDIASRRRAQIEEVGAATACEIFASRIAPGQYYRLADGVWRLRQGNAPVPRPGYCG